MVGGVVDDVDPRVVLHLGLLLLHADQRLVQIEHQCLLICIKYIKSVLIIEGRGGRAALNNRLCVWVCVSLRGDFLKYV